jgi:hypothetical protein
MVADPHYYESLNPDPHVKMALNFGENFFSFFLIIWGVFCLLVSLHAGITNKKIILRFVKVISLNFFL